LLETILIVDDQEINLKLLEKVMRSQGYCTHVARDGRQAVASARRLLPDLILLDIVMPEFDGFQVCTELRASAQTGHIPIIFLSAKNKPEDIARGLELGGSDYVAKPFNKLEILARVKTHLSLHRKNRDLETAGKMLRARQDRIAEDLLAAASIQQSLLPKQNPDLDFGRLDWAFLPCEQVAGDIFNFFPLDETHWAMYIIDVCGHGVPSAMIAVSVSQVLNPLTGLLTKDTTCPAPPDPIVSPGAVMAELNRLFPFDRFQKFFTISYVICHLPSGQIRYSSAGHPPPVVLRARGGCETLSEGGPLIGFDQPLPHPEGRTVLGSGDRLFLYTDGLYEHQGASGDRFGMGRLLDILAARRDLPLAENVSGTIESVKAFGNGTAPSDDISILGFEYLGVP
jgi:sigma-B regulation protein RsbU (phosphoserine phosphatase)